MTNSDNSDSNFVELVSSFHEIETSSLKILMIHKFHGVLSMATDPESHCSTVAIDDAVQFVILISKIAN